jgi:hypothetical protein
MLIYYPTVKCNLGHGYYSGLVHRYVQTTLGPESVIDFNSKYKLQIVTVVIIIFHFSKISYLNTDPVCIKLFRHNLKFALVPCLYWCHVCNCWLMSNISYMICSYVYYFHTPTLVITVKMIADWKFHTTMLFYILLPDIIPGPYMKWCYHCFHLTSS